MLKKVQRNDILLFTIIYYNFICTVTKTLLNFHSPAIIGAGVIRRKRDNNSRRELTRTDVDVPDQMREYSETFHWIDKGNQVEAKFDLGGESHSHGWTPKLGCF